MTLERILNGFKESYSPDNEDSLMQELVVETITKDGFLLTWKTKDNKYFTYQYF